MSLCPRQKGARQNHVKGPIGGVLWMNNRPRSRSPLSIEMKGAASISTRTEGGAAEQRTRNRESAELIAHGYPGFRGVRHPTPCALFRFVAPSRGSCFPVGRQVLFALLRKISA